MQIIHTTEKGEIVILYDSRWRFPELLGYKKSDPEYKRLRKVVIKNEQGNTGKGI
jgi:hypothetical protein